MEASFSELSDSYVKIANELTASEDEAGANQQKIIETLGSLSDIKSNLSRLQAEKTLLGDNLKNLEQDTNAIANKNAPAVP